MADERPGRPPLNALGRQSGEEAAGTGFSIRPERIEARPSSDGGRVAALVCGERGRVHDVGKERWWRWHSNGGAQQEDAARHSEVGASEPTNWEGHRLGETEAAHNPGAWGEGLSTLTT
jgi:hypothetical protein